MGGRRFLDDARRPSTTSRVRSHDEVVEGAARWFAREATIDMQAIADALAISRATLYRIAGDQDQLLGDVLWLLTARTTAIAEQAARGSGVERLMDTSRRFQALVRDFSPLRRFTEQEPERAFRVLFTAGGDVHRRTVAHWTALLQTAAAAGELTLPFPAEQFAEMFVRLGESMLWSDLLGGSPVDVALWEQVQRALFDLHLREDG